MVVKARILKGLNFFQKNTLLFAASMIFFSSSLQAEWDPDYFVEDISILKVPGFKNLKAHVLESLVNSWCSQEKANLLMDLVAITKPKVCVEIGAFTGSSVLPVAATLKYLGQGKIFAIDAWSNADAILHLDEDDTNRSWWSAVDMDQAQNTCMQMIKSWSLNSYCTVIKNPSEKAVQQVDTIDFLHFDGDFSEIGSLQDVKLYLPKVKSGGYILLSNLYITIKSKQPKMKAFCALFEACDMICEIERDNTLLFRKR
jgi:hypothetical protein